MVCLNCALAKWANKHVLTIQRCSEWTYARAVKELVSGLQRFLFKYKNLETMMQVRFIAIFFIFLHRIFTKFFVILIFSHIKVHRKFCKSCNVFWCAWNLLLKLAYAESKFSVRRYVGNLDRRCTEEFLKQVFGKIAPVERCKMIYDVSKWCAF